MNSGPGFLRTVLVGTKGCLVIITCWDMWGQFPLCQELCVAVDVKGVCFSGYIDAAAKQDQCS